MNNLYKEVLNPLLYSFYCEEAGRIMSEVNSDFSERIVTISNSILDVKSIDAKEYLLEDFGQSYNRKYRSIVSAVSVQSINWELILPFLKGIDSTTLFIIMHKIFLQDLVYNSSSDNNLPIDLMEFYHLDWTKKLNRKQS